MKKDKLVSCLIASTLVVGTGVVTAAVTQDKLTSKFTAQYNTKVAELTEIYNTTIENHEKAIVQMNEDFEATLEHSIEVAVAQAKQETLAYSVANFRATAYSPLENFSGMEHDGDATATSTGMAPGPKVFAVDPTVIPYYSNMIVIYPNGEILTGVAGDTGGLIKGNKIDVYKYTYAETIEHGIRDCVVIWWQ